MGGEYWLAGSYAVEAEPYRKEGDQLKTKEDLGKSMAISKECVADGWVQIYEKELGRYKG